MLCSALQFVFGTPLLAVFYKEKKDFNYRFDSSFEYFWRLHFRLFHIKYKYILMLSKLEIFPLFSCTWLGKLILFLKHQILFYQIQFPKSLKLVKFYAHTFYGRKFYNSFDFMGAKCIPSHIIIIIPDAFNGQKLCYGRV